MPETDKNRIPRNIPRADITIEQLVANSLVTMAAALQEIAEVQNDICAHMEVLKDLEVKKCSREGILTPEELEEYLGNEDDDETPDK